MPLNAAVMTLYNDIPGRCKSCECDRVTEAGWQDQVRCVVVTRLNCLNLRGGEERERECLHKYHYNTDISGDNTHT